MTTDFFFNVPRGYELSNAFPRAFLTTIHADDLSREIAEKPGPVQISVVCLPMEERTPTLEIPSKLFGDPRYL